MARSERRYIDHVLAHGVTMYERRITIHDMGRYGEVVEWMDRRVYSPAEGHGDIVGKDGKVVASWDTIASWPAGGPAPKRKRGTG